MAFPVGTTKNFDDHFSQKPRSLQDTTKRKIKLLAENPRHPSLNVHRVDGTDGVWEAYIDMSHRLTFEYQDGGIVLRNNNGHDILKRP